MVLLILTLLEIIVSLFIGNYKYRISALFRPWFLIHNQKFLRIELRLLFATVMASVDVLLAIFLLVFTFSTAVYFLVDANFTDPVQSFMNFFILLSTVNFPEVMMPLLEINRVFALIFVVYLIIGLYLLMNFLLITVANIYLRYLKQMASKGKLKNLDAAFDCLCAISPHDDCFPFGIWKRLFQVYQPRLRPEEVEWIFHETDTDKSGTIDRPQFRAVFGVLARIDVVRVGKVHKFFERHEGKRNPKVVEFIKKYELFWIFALIALDFVLYLVMVYLPPSLRLTPFYVTHLPILFLCLSFLFVVDIILRLYAHGTFEFWKSLRNRANLLAAGVSFPVCTYYVIKQLTVGATPTEWKVLATVLTFTSLRIFEIIFHVGKFADIVRSVLSISSAFSSFVVLLLLVLYEFAIVGMWLFGGVIDRDNLNPVLDGTSYVQGGYQHSAFNNILESYIVLFELLIVNNWHLIAEGYMLVTTRWAFIYFALFFVFIVTVALNILVAFFLRSFSLELDKRNKSASDVPEAPETPESITEREKKEQFLLLLQANIRTRDLSSTYTMQFRQPTISELLEGIQE